ncbi:MAG: serine hydrolase [Myxococcales bacterium]|nr:serine hydrolase [Myxococcales bacterium]
MSAALPLSPEALRRRRSLRSLVVILILGVVGTLILVFRAKLRGPSDPDAFLEALPPLRDDVALVAFTVGPEGKPVPGEGVVRHNADQMFPLAAVSRIPVLLAYARAVDEGRVTADEAVTVSEWERHYLPGTDGGAHGKALRAFDLKLAQGGFALEPRKTVTLDQLATAMITHGDHAAGDYLIGRLGEGFVDAVVRDAGLQHHDPVLPNAALFLLASTAGDEAGARALLAKGRPAVAQAARTAWQAFLRDEAGTPAQRTWLDKHPTPEAGVQSLWSDQAMTQGAAGEYADLLARVAVGAWGTPKQGEIVRRHLGWPLALEGNAELFTALGSKGGTLVSIMTEAMYAVPKQGDFQGKTRVVVFFQRRMPSLRWFALVRSFIHQHFMLKLAVDRAFFEATDTQLRSAPSP